MPKMIAKINKNGAVRLPILKKWDEREIQQWWALKRKSASQPTRALVYIQENTCNSTTEDGC